MSSLDHLQKQWKQLFQHTLPDAACAKDTAQPIWPVHVDHCFARIILDCVVGKDTPWMDKLKAPAWKNLTEEQLKECVKMGEGIMDGSEDLVELDNKSLGLRGKANKGGKRVEVAKKNDEKKSKQASGEKGQTKEQKDGKVSKYFTKQNLGKRERSDEQVEADDDDEAKVTDDESDTKQSTRKNPRSKQQTQSSPQSGPKRQKNNDTSSPTSKQTSSPPPNDFKTSRSSNNLKDQLTLISNSSKTPFQKRVLSLLCQIPPGHYTTYGLLSTHLSSSPRAVGNALRNNPFAPEVPCHRVLATGGGIGGFGGSWGKGGKEGLNDVK